MLAMISSEVHSSHSKAALLPCSALDELLSLSLRKEPCQPICCFARRRTEKEESWRRKCFKHPAGRLHWQVFHQYWGCKKETFLSVDSFQIPRKFHPSMVLWRSKNRPGKCQHTLTHQFVRFYRTQVWSLHCVPWSLTDFLVQGRPPRKTHIVKFGGRVAELGSLSSWAKMAKKIFVKREVTIFTTNASGLRAIANLQN